eukprot:jgi/Hompol1/2591/HPOL_006059-RA
MARNWILALWRFDPSRHLDFHKHVKHVIAPVVQIGLFDDQMALNAYRYLDRARLINFGVFMGTPDLWDSRRIGKDTSRRPKIVVVGAGIAGLTAAREILNIYVNQPDTLPPDIVVLEARKRLGGRIFTFPLHAVRDSSGPPSGLDLVFCPDGSQVDRETYRLAEKLFNEILDLACRSAAEKTKKRPLDCASVKDSKPPDAFVTLGGGLGQIPHALANGVKKGQFRLKVEYEKHATAISFVDSPGSASVLHAPHGMATVSCSDGTAYVCDAVVVALPIGILKSQSVKFDPPLPDWKVRAIDSIDMGLVNKVAMLFPNRFWDIDMDSFGCIDELLYSRSHGEQLPPNLSRGRFFMFQSLYEIIKLPVLVAHISGDAALELEAETDESLVDSAMEILSLIFSSKAPLPMPLETLVTRWSKDQFAL